MITYGVAERLILISDEWLKPQTASNIVRWLCTARQHDVIVLFKHLIAHTLLKKVLLGSRLRDGLFHLVVGDQSFLHVGRVH